MNHRVASALLVVALVLASGSALSAHMPPNRRSLRQRELLGGCQCGVNEFARVHLHGQASGTTTLVGDRHHHLSVALATVRSRIPTFVLARLPRWLGCGRPGSCLTFRASPCRSPRTIVPTDHHASSSPPAPHLSSVRPPRNFPNPVCKKSAHHCRPSTEDGCWEVTTSRPAVGGIP